MLYLVATPIGNLADITSRAIETLKSVDLIACEDTRHTKILLDRYGITTSTVSYHQHSSLQKIDWLVGQLAEGKQIALVTDAGTPGISDPGGVLVQKVHEYNREAAKPISIISVPGASSLTAALSVSGFPADTFLFLGFLPKKKGRQSLLASLASLDKPLGIETIAFFESAIRINQTLIDIQTTFLQSSLTGAQQQDRGSRAKRDSRSEALPLSVGNDKIVSVCLCRELTKQFEEIWRGSLAEAIEKTKKPQKGEFVVVLHFNR